MKLKKLLAIAIAFAVQNPVQADDTLVILSPHQSPQAVQAQLQDTLSIFLSQDAGEKITYIDGETGKTIATLDVPQDKRLAQHQSSRLNHNKAALASLGLFAKSVSIEDRTAGAMNLPLTLKEIARYHRDISDIVIIGTVRMDIKGVAPSVQSGAQYLLDSNINQSSRDGIFGVTDRLQLLKGFRIHWWVLSDYEDRAIRLATERFWHLWLHHQSAQLVSYSSDKNVVLQSLKDNAPALPMPYALELPPVITLQPADNHGLFARPLSTQSLSSARWRTLQKVQLGIRWQGHSDLDIYAALDHKQPPIFFANPNMEAGRHLKDIQSGSDGKGNTHFETIIYDQSVVDLCQLVMGINHFGGAAPDAEIDGLLRVEIDGRIFERAFKVGRAQGNKGADMEAVLGSGKRTPYSQFFTLADVTGGFEQACRS